MNFYVLGGEVEHDVGTVENEDRLGFCEVFTVQPSVLASEVREDLAEEEIFSQNRCDEADQLGVEAESIMGGERVNMDGFGELIGMMYVGSHAFLSELDDEVT